MEQAQSFKNHGRIVPMFHIGVFGIFIINVLWALSQLRGGVTGQEVMNLLLGIGLLLLFFSVRAMILRVQDRLIRLEMRLRLRDVLPADLQTNIPQLTVGQLIALRFASDAELAELVREILAGRLTSRKDIKMRIKDWQADYLRA
jgi:uncharacterized membrane protein YheB (UPF0754 family)